MSEALTLDFFQKTCFPKIWIANLFSLQLICWCLRYIKACEIYQLAPGQLLNSVFYLCSSWKYEYTFPQQGFLVCIPHRPGISTFQGVFNSQGSLVIYLFWFLLGVFRALRTIYHKEGALGYYRGKELI